MVNLVGICTLIFLTIGCVQSPTEKHFNKALQSNSLTQIFGSISWDNSHDPALLNALQSETYKVSVKIGFNEIEPESSEPAFYVSLVNSKNEETWVKFVVSTNKYNGDILLIDINNTFYKANTNADPENNVWQLTKTTKEEAYTIIKYCAENYYKTFDYPNLLLKHLGFDEL